MKAIIYAGIGLFAAASIYGVTDYFSSEKKGTLKNLYKEEQPDVVSDKKAEPNNVVGIKNTTVVIKSSNNSTAENIEKKTRQKAGFKQRRTIKLDDFSRGRIPDIIPLTEEIIVDPVKEPETSKEENPAVVEKKEEIINEPVTVRKISLSDFSRARPVSVRKVRTAVKVN